MGTNGDKELIGISILDSLSNEELVKVVTGKMRIRVPEKMSSIPTTVIMSDNDPLLMKPMMEMDNDRVVTLCKMEIESRIGWIYLRELLDAEHSWENVKN